MCGRDFVCVYQYIGEFVRSIWEWQRRGKAKWRQKDTSWFFLFFLHPSAMPSIHLSFLSDNMITLCTCWLQYAYYQTISDPTTSQCCKLQLLFPIQSCAMKLFGSDMQFYVHIFYEWQFPHFHCFARGFPEGGWTLATHPHTMMLGLGDK